MGDIRPPLDDALDAFGLAATVTRPAPDNTPIVTTGFWLRPIDMARPYGQMLQRVEPNRVFVLPRATVPTLPIGTEVDAALALGGTVINWRVESLEESADPDHWRAVMVQ